MRIKNNIKIIITVLITGLMLGLQTNLALATTIGNNSIAYLDFQGFVPDGFTSDLLATINDKDGKLVDNVLLTHDEGYKKTYKVTNGQVYYIKIQAKGNDASTYTAVGINDTGYDFKNTNNCLCAFTITKTSDTVSQTTNNSGTDQQQIDKLNKAIEGKSKNIIVSFIQATEFMENNDKYKNFLSMWKVDSMKTGYLKLNTNATDKEWNALTDYEAFVYYFCYENPYSSIVNLNSNRADTLSSLNGIKTLLSATGDSNNQSVYNACQSVTAYLWDTYTEKGSFENLYETKGLSDVIGKSNNKLDIPKIMKITVEEQTNNNNSNNKKEKPNSSSTSKKTENGDKMPMTTSTNKLIKDNWIYILILLGLLGGIGYYFFFKKENRVSEKR